MHDDENPQRALEQLSSKLPTFTIDRSGRLTAISERAQFEFELPTEVLLNTEFAESFPRVVDSAGDETEELRQWHDEQHPAYRRFRVDWLDGRAGSRVAVLTDRTATHRARRECLRLSRLASAGRLISGIVHEINNPLSGIIGYSQLLMLKELDAEAHRHVERIHGEAQRTSRIVRSLLDFTRRRTNRPTGVRLASVLEKAIELKAHDLRVRNISNHVVMPEDLPLVMGDPHQILQVMVNLITNAEQAMHSTDRGGRIAFHARAVGDTVVLRIEDTGPGIPEHLLDRIFEPFFTTKTEGIGTGLGLGLCRDVLARFDATIDLLPSNQVGAVFALTFQLAPDESRGAQEPRRAREPHVTGRKIVVVEDDPVCRSLVVDSFEPQGNQVYAFDRSEPALQFLERHVVDVIVSDLHRPGLNGLEFLERVRLFDEPLASRVVFLTGDTLDEQLAEAVKRTGNLLVAKPTTIHDLRSAVARIVSRPANRQKTLFRMESD